MKIIDFETIRNAEILNNYKELYKWVDYALTHKDLFDMPTKSRISQENGNYFAIMPCMYKPDNVAFVKMIGRHNIIDESDKRSVMMSDILLYDANTGLLKALMDGEYITTLRTGVVAAHSTLLFAKKDYYEIGLLGLGNIMFAFLHCFLQNYDGRKLKIKLLAHNGQEERLMKAFQHYPNIDFFISSNYDNVISNSDIVVSAVTKTSEDFCDDSKYKEGCTVIPICTLGFQNCDLFFDKVFTDEIEQIRHFKYFESFKSVANVTDVLLGKKEGRTDDKERIIVYNYGLSIHDLYFASMIYKLSNNIPETEYKYCSQKFFMK